MAWLAANWFSVLIFIAFVTMHIFGHGGHSGHSGHDKRKNRDQREKDEAQSNVMNARVGRHQH